MDIRLAPTLAVQRQLYAMPANTERFQWYLQQMVGDHPDDIRLPIANINPMGKEHCGAAVEALMAIDAEREVSRAIDEAKKRLKKVDGVAIVALNLIDDLAGGWTNRYFTEAQLRFGSDQALRSERHRHFVVVPAWSSETYARETVRRETLASVYRYAWRSRHGVAATLAGMMRAEGLALRFAGAQDDASGLMAPSVNEETLRAARDVVEANAGSDEFPVQAACFFGDEAASEMGYAALGVAKRAGFAVALAGVSKLDPVSELLKAPSKPLAAARAPMRLA